MKKAVRIMQNPLVMKDAFRKFNFTKYIYSEDGKGGVDVELALSEGSGGDSHRKQRRATVSSSTSNQSPQRLATSEMLEDAASERLPARRLNKNLIKVESHTRRQAQGDRQAKRAAKSPIKGLTSSLPVSRGHEPGSLCSSSKVASQTGHGEEDVADG